MSQAIKDWIEQDMENALENFALGRWSLDEAKAVLVRLGFDPQDAFDMLQEAIS